MDERYVPVEVYANMLGPCFLEEVVPMTQYLLDLASYGFVGNFFRKLETETVRMLTNAIGSSEWNVSHVSILF